jgi:hypothetical protein
LVYKVPSELSARRVFVWRKLRRLGVLRIHDSIWVSPATPSTREQIQRLATKIKKLEDNALVWRHLAAVDQKSALAAPFVAQVSFHGALSAVVRRALTACASGEVIEGGLEASGRSPGSKWASTEWVRLLHHGGLCTFSPML